MAGDGLRRMAGAAARGRWGDATDGGGTAGAAVVAAEAAPHMVAHGAPAAAGDAEGDAEGSKACECDDALSGAADGRAPPPPLLRPPNGVLALLYALLAP